MQTAYNSYVEWGKYLQELFNNKKNDIATGKAQEGMDLMASSSEAPESPLNLSSNPLLQTRTNRGKP